jgi:hypothetical protein
MTYSNSSNQIDTELAESIDESLEIEELSEGDLDAVSGGCGHHHRRRKSHRKHGGGLAGHGGHGGHGGHQSSSADFDKHTLSIAGQTITQPDGTSITSFAIHEEDTHSHSEQSIG